MSNSAPALLATILSLSACGADEHAIDGSDEVATEPEVASDTGTNEVPTTVTETVDEPVEVVACAPGTRRCEGANVLECRADGSGPIVEVCDTAAGATCAGGRCLSRCEVQGAKLGYIACDFWAADLPNDESAVDNIFAFAFTNASPRVANVRITYPWGPVEEVAVPVDGVATHKLPVPRTLSQISRPGLGRAGFHIESDQPIAAFMFNPLERYDLSAEHTVATNDASILYPTPALGTRYLAVTWSDPGQFSGPPFVTIVATHADTRVVVTTPEPIVMDQSPFVIPQDTPTTLTLQAFETLNLEPRRPGARTDMTGASIVSENHPIAVFSGNRCARVPDSGRFCDHIEAQLPPLETWGDTFVVTKFTDRGGEHDYFRIMAQADATELTVDPEPAVPPPVLAAGEMWQTSSKAGFVLRASKPVLVAQFMASQNMTTPPGPFGVSGDCPPEIGGTCQGDPSLVLVAPVAQWPRDPIFLVPDTYRHQFVNIAFPAEATVVLDDLTVDTSAATTMGDWRAITLPVAGGYHRVTGSAPVGVVVYGYDHNISYAYNGGLELGRLEP